LFQCPFGQGFRIATLPFVVPGVLQSSCRKWEDEKIFDLFLGSLILLCNRLDGEQELDDVRVIEAL